MDTKKWYASSVEGNVRKRTEEWTQIKLYTMNMSCLIVQSITSSCCLFIFVTIVAGQLKTANPDIKEEKAPTCEYLTSHLNRVPRYLLSSDKHLSILTRCRLNIYWRLFLLFYKKKNEKDIYIITNKYDTVVEILNHILQTCKYCEHCLLTRI